MKKRSILDGIREDLRFSLFYAAKMPEIEPLLERMKKNWSGGKSRGRINWHLRYVPLPPGSSEKGRYSPGSEVLLERKIAEAFNGKKCLWNQMPVASGLLNRSNDADKGKEEPRRAVDLVFQPDKSVERYQLLELKVARENSKPDSFNDAAAEVIEYGLLYLFSRKHKVDLGYVDDRYKILEASEINLRVIAPPPYFQNADVRSELDSFPFASVNDAFDSFLGQVGLKMDLGAEVIDCDASSSFETLRAAIQGKSDITPRRRDS